MSKRGISNPQTSKLGISFRGIVKFLFH